VLKMGSAPRSSLGGACGLRRFQAAAGTTPGVDHLLIFGSWPARYKGEAGPPPNDLDVLVVGTPDRTAVYDAAEEVERRTGLPVNPVIAAPTRWADHDEPLMTQIKSGPTVAIDLADLAPPAEAK
jgi:predicted nucleotidyltransferase